MASATITPKIIKKDDRKDDLKAQALVIPYSQLSIKDIPIAGGKNASLGEMFQQLTPKGVRIPPGFATTAHAYREFIRQNGLDPHMRRILHGVKVSDVADVQKRGEQIRSLLLSVPLPKELETAILEGYEKLCAEFGADTDVAVRSSATAEDLPDASFAGQHETYLNVRGGKNVIEACRQCIASMFTDRAICYREDKGFDHHKIALSVGVQKMVRSDLAASGVVFSIDTETGFRDAVLINSAYGLGENVVKGVVSPDEYIVFKPTLKKGFKPILAKRLGSKNEKLIYTKGSFGDTINVPVHENDRRKFSLSDEEALQLARWACVIEEHYATQPENDSPMDIEWAKDGNTGQLFIVQARAETVQSRKRHDVVYTYKMKEAGRILLTGRSIGEAIGQGKARVIEDVTQLNTFVPGEVLIADRTDPDWEPIMKKAGAIVTNRGGRTCHAAIIARELGIPAVVGTSNATTTLTTGQEITICCAEGEEGRVYEGHLKFEVKEESLTNLPRTRTQILMNVGNPDDAFRLAETPCDGVGLARLEFIIANHIQMHPLALLHFDELKDEAVKARIAEITRGYANKAEYFVEKLAQGVSMITAAFYPKPVIVRLSDFKTNEYANLIGGKQFEPAEENPMIGWRGASRYYDANYRDGFALECEAMRRVRDEMGLTNLVLMVPFCRTPEEGVAVIEEMHKHGLQRFKNGLQIYVMCEIPSNVILADRFSEIFDGFSIGSNDLTQLTLGLDRDSNLVARLFDERNEAVKRMLQMAIRGAKKGGRKIGICGQAPSDYPEFAAFLVSEGIDSISLNPDSVLKTLKVIAEAERVRDKIPA